MKKIILLHTLFIAVLSNAQTWQNCGSSGIVSESVLNPIDYPSIALDVNNVPYVCFIDGALQSQPIVKKLNGNNWVSIGNTTTNETSFNSSIAVNNLNVPYIAYYSTDLITTNALGIVKKFDGINWVNVGVNGFVNETVGEIILKIDNNNMPYVAYQSFSNPDYLVVKKFDGTSWVSLGTVINSSVIDFDFELDNNNIPYITYHVLAGQNVATYCKKFIGTNWVNVGENGLITNIGSRSSLAFDNSNAPNVAFISGNNDDLFVKKFNGTTWANVGGLIATTLIDNPKIALGLNNIPVVAYNDPLNNAINVKSWNGSTWNLITTPTSIEQTQNSLSIAISSNNIPFVAYSTESNVKTKFYGTTLSTNQNEFLADVNIYPNPTSDYINIDSKSTIIATSMTDILGKTIYNRSGNLTKINISNLNNGVYVLQVSNLEGSKNFKIIKK